MKIKYIIIILLFSLSSVNSIGYVLNCPGTTYYSTYQTITFSSCVNSSYFEVGDDYFVISDINITLESLSSYHCDYNLSFFNDTFDNHTKTNTPYRFFEFNATYTYINPSVDIYLDMPDDYFLIDMYLDNVLNNADVTESGGKYTFSFDNDGNNHRFCFYIADYIPECPTNASSTYNITANAANLTWDAADRADSYVVVRSSSGYPSSISDGTIVHNSSSLFYNVTITSSYYFSVWSYNNTGEFSPDNCKLDLPWGAINISVYNESNPSMEISPFGLLITNSDGTITYQVSSATNPHSIDINDIPYGENTIIIINASTYTSRTYYKDLVQNQYYKYNFYLPPFQTETDPGGGNAGDDDEFITTQDYVVQVIDEINNPIQNAKVVIRFYDNNTDSYNEVASLITDGYGQTETVPLIPQTLYKVNISADNYQSLTGQNWRPSNIVFDTDRYKTFTLTASETDFENETSYDEIILFNGHLVDNNNTICVNFSCSDNNAVNTSIKLFETNHSDNITALRSDNFRTGDNNYQVWFTGINTSNTYTVYLHLNHTVFNYTIDMFIISGHPFSSHDESIVKTSQNEFNMLLDNVIGTTPFTWSAIFGIIILLAGLFAFGQRNVGLSMLITGFILLGFNVVIGFDMLSSSVCIVLILLGVLVQWQVSRRVDKG